MEMIQDGSRARLVREPDSDAVEIEVVGDPLWTRAAQPGGPCHNA
jgi:hypothetical protein